MMGFCEKCHEMKECLVRELEAEKTIKGKLIRYIAKEAYCSECGDAIFIASIRDHNLNMIDIGYRAAENLITIEEIDNILEKYSIGKRPLSLLLGWGEVTLTRYLDGDIPTKQYSDVLKRLIVDSDFMYTLLEQNKDNISNRTYVNCKDAVDRILKPICNEPKSKIDSIVKYIIKLSNDITPLALQKLLYYSQGFYKAFYGEYLFDNDCEAWVHGPVYRSIYYDYMTYGYNQINSISENNKFKLCENEEELLDSIITYFGCYSGKILERMTHKECPWMETRMGLAENIACDRIISRELIGNYFISIKDKYEMLNICDIKDYSKDLFDKLCC